nr:MAG TPA: hypothetical protein [Caudoviricetes sp.]
MVTVERLLASTYMLVMGQGRGSPPSSAPDRR